MKTLYLVRHGHAVNVGSESISSDFDRHLTQEGEAFIEKTLKGLLQLGVSFDHCFTSPLLRAKQTSKILSRPFSCEPIEFNALGPEPAFSSVHKALENTDGEQVLMVSHVPFIAKLAAYFTQSDASQFHFKPGTVACLHIESLAAEPQGQLMWVSDHKILNLI